MEGSRHRKHCHRVKEQVRAFSIEARRRQQEDARWKGRHPRPLRLDPIPYAQAARALWHRAKQPQRAKLAESVAGCAVQLEQDACSITSGVYPGYWAAYCNVLPWSA